MPENDHGEGRLHRNLSNQQNAIQEPERVTRLDAKTSTKISLLREQAGWETGGRSHKELVDGFRTYIREYQEEYQRIRSPKDREFFPPSEIIRKKLDWQSGSTNQLEGEFFSTLRYAWDIRAYDGYDAGYLAENLAGSTLSMYYHATQEPVIKLTDPVQVRMIDALAEAAGIQHRNGQSEFEIPENLRNYNKWVLSKEYEERLAHVAARARGESPERPDQTQNAQSPVNGKIQHESYNETATDKLPIEQEKFYQAFWNNVIERASTAPLGEDPAFWPIDVLNQLEYLLSEDRKFIKDKAKYELAGKLAPIKDSIRKVRTAYEIAAYPQCEQSGRRESIEAELELDRQIHGRDKVELNDMELDVIRKLCETPRYSLQHDTKTLQPEIPFDPQKRIYKYSEVALSPHIDPLGKRHVPTNKINS